MSDLKDSYFDLIVVGTGFASTFFLYRFLKKYPKKKVLVLERGASESHAWKLQHVRTHNRAGVVSAIDCQSTFENVTPEKPWNFTVGLGGGSNCWAGCTPRFLPSDFQLKSLYGVGVDWPISYEELEPYYVEAEALMNISGSKEDAPFPMSAPYPQPPHRMNQFDEALKKIYGPLVTVMPTARARTAAAGRAACCANGTCFLCPVNAKFTILGHLPEPFQNDQVSVITGAEVKELEIVGNSVRKVMYRKDGSLLHAQADRVALGANAIVNPFILLRSGLTHSCLGRYLSEQRSFSVFFHLAELDNYQGSTLACAHGYMAYDGQHRKERAAALLESWNVPQLRLERGKYTQTALVKFLIEDLGREENCVSVSSDGERPRVTYLGPSPYLEKGEQFLRSNLQQLFGKMPIERIVNVSPLTKTESHLLGTTRMGLDNESSVIDGMQLHHTVRNLFVLGGGSFPTISPSNPSLTIAALSLRSAALAA